MNFDTPFLRDQKIDMVKTVAIWCVVLCHVASAPFSCGTVGTTSWYSALLWASLTHACVPLFFMASGALLLKPEKDLTFKKLYTKKLPRLLAALFFWAFCYKLVSLKLMDSLALPDIVDAVKHLLLFHHEEHLYYLHISLLTYAALPITRLIVRYADKQLLKYALILWFLLGILYPTIRTFWPFTLLNGIPVQWRMNMTYASIGYMLLGHYLSVYHPPTESCYFLYSSVGGISPDLLGYLHNFLQRWQTIWPLFRGREHICFSGCFRDMEPLSNSFSFASGQTADRLYFQSRLLHLSHSYFLFTGICTVWTHDH